MFKQKCNTDIKNKNQNKEPQNKWSRTILCKIEPPKSKENLISQNGNYLEKNFNPQFKKKKDGERQNAVPPPTKKR